MIQNVVCAPPPLAVRPTSILSTPLCAATGRLQQQLGHAPAALAVTAADASGEQQAPGCTALLWLPPTAAKVRHNQPYALQPPPLRLQPGKKAERPEARLEA